jgi:hypothetical protein
VAAPAGGFGEGDSVGSSGRGGRTGSGAAGPGANGFGGGGVSRGGGSGAQQKVLLGGTECTLGEKTSSLRKIVSDSLRCTRCAQAVLRFAGTAWQVG